ncbi:MULTISPECIES: DUF4365 domain-containing protein [Streptomyces]|uniref:DUF4365 domain-containing protein n=1 Tax=Streptomyces TaxID=1883 RepID=UPI0031FA1786
MSPIGPSRRIEKAGCNALRTLLEDNDHIVQEIAGQNDFGEDFIVNLTRNGKRTGHWIAIQVKSGKKYKRRNGYSIPVGDHFDDWRDSKIPVIGVVYDLETSSLFWVNLTRELRASNSPISQIKVSPDSRLSAETIRGFTADIEAYADNLGMRVRGTTDEEALAAALKAMRGVDPETSPNPMYEGFADFALRHEEKIDTIARDIRRAIPVLLLLIVMAWEWPYQMRFVERYSDLSPVIWTLNLYLFIFYMAMTMYFEFRAGRIPKETGSWLSIIIGTFLWIPVWDPGGEPGWFGTLWITLGVVVPSFGYKALLVFFVGYAKERRRRRT